MRKIHDNAERAPGVYKIRNKINGCTYYGSCKSFKTRWRQHKRQLEIGEHRNPKLLNDFNFYGLDAFMFEVIEVIEGDKELRLDAEQKLLDLYWDGGKRCYNVSKYARSAEGQPFSNTPEETRRKISQKAKERLKDKNKNPFYGKKHTEETKKKIGEASKGRKSSMKGKHPSEETRKKMSQKAKERIGNLNPFYGKHHSKETKQKLSKVKKGKPNGRAHDLTGKLFGFLLVLCRTRSTNKNVAWLCKCICGKETKARTGDLLNGKHKSCGCRGLKND